MKLQNCDFFYKCDIFPQFLFQLSYVGRAPLGTAAAGVGKVHQQEAKEVVTQAFQG